MRAISLFLCVVLLTAVNAVASDSGAVIAEVIQTYEQIEAIRSEMREASGDLSDEKRAYELAIYELKGEPKPQEQLDKLAGSIKQQEKSLKRIEANDGSSKSLAYAKRRIRDLSLILEASGLKTEAEREAHRRKLQPNVDELIRRIQAIEGPFKARIEAIENSAEAGNDALTAVIRPHIKTPESIYPGSTIQQFNATAHMAFGASHWQDSEKGQIAWAHIRIRPLDEIQDYHREKLLDGTYPIQSLSDGSLWVWAGHFLITFVVDDESLKGEESIQKVIHQFVDLEGLAAIKAEAKQVAAGEIAE